MFQIEDEHVKKGFGMLTWAWWFVGALFFLFAMLANYKNGLQFNGTVIFAITWIVGILLLNILPRTGLYDRLEGHEGLNVFWFENPNRSEWWVPIAGFGGVFGASYLGSIINNPLAGIFGSGIVLVIMLFGTRSILIPIMVHGSFNVFVILSQNGLFGQSLIPLAVNPSFAYSVPTIGNAIPSLSPLISEVMNQLFLVSPAEEILKVMAIAGFIVFFKGYYVENTGIKWLAAIGAILIWAYLHVLQAL